MGSYGKENNTLTITTDAVEQVQTFKLLGVVISHTLSWDDHITAITAKAAKRMWFLKKLKRADVSTEDLTYYYQAVIRPVLQYSMLAQPGIPVSQKDKRKHWRMFSTVQFKSSATTSRMKTPVVCSNCAHWQRDVWSSAELFQQIVRGESHALHYLLPPKRDIQLVRRLRSTRTIPTVYAMTSHFKNSFILNALNTFQ